MILFADTSALIKLYIAEVGSEAMQRLVAGKNIAVTPLAYAEAHATFARRLREGLLDSAEADQIGQQYEREWKTLLQVPVLEITLTLVPGLCRKYPLRGADAIQLASSLFLRKAGLEVTFASSDRELLDAARSEGLEIVDPVDL